MGKKRIIILGAGLTGLSAAWHLQKKGIDCQVFEKDGEVGGLCRSKKIGSFIFDCDGHLLHFRQPYAFNLVKKLLGDNLARHQRNAFVYSHDKYIPYPFQANLHSLPSQVINECVGGLIQATKSANPLKNKKGLSFLEWMNRAFGKGISRHFMVPYNTKFWTVSPQELTCEWLDGFIPVPSLKEVIKGAAGKNRKRFGYNAYFWYPKNGGIMELPLALSRQVRNIYTNSAVTEIDLVKKEIRLSSGKREKFDYLISTLPLPELPAMLREIPQALSSQFKKLRWTSVFNLNLGLEKKDNLNRHWIYFPQAALSFFRVGFFHNFSPQLAPAGKGSLYIEVSYSKDKPINKQEINAKIKHDLRGVGILNGGRIACAHINDIKYAYPVYDHNYATATKEILNFLGKNQVISCGRYGSWRYMSMEDSLMQARELAKMFDKR